MHPASDHLTYVPLARLTCWICQGTLPWQPNNFGWNEKVMKADWYHVHSLHVCQVLARLYFTTTCYGRHCGTERAICWALPCISSLYLCWCLNDCGLLFWKFTILKSEVPVMAKNVHVAAAKTLASGQWPAADWHFTTSKMGDLISTGFLANVRLSILPECSKTCKLNLDVIKIVLVKH